MSPRVPSLPEAQTAPQRSLTIAERIFRSDLEVHVISTEDRERQQADDQKLEQATAKEVIGVAAVYRLDGKIVVDFHDRLLGLVMAGARLDHTGKLNVAEQVKPFTLVLGSQPLVGGLLETLKKATSPLSLLGL